MALRNGLLALLVIALPQPATSEAANGRCAHQSSEVSRVGVAKARQATLCLINRERARRGLTGLVVEPRLRRAANRHAREMVRKGYFAHGTFTDRLTGVGYPFGTKYLVGENLAWGTGSLASPARVMRTWMRSPGHRRNIVFAPYRAIGVGVAHGVPAAAGRGGATYVTDFGSYAASSRLPLPPLPLPTPPAPPPPEPPPPTPEPGPGPLCQAARTSASGHAAAESDGIVLGTALFALTGC